MNNNFTAYEAERISEKYRTREVTALDELRALDTKVKRPANVFAYTFGAIGAIVMGSGMSLIMSDLWQILELTRGLSLAIGIPLGIAGGALASFAYPMYNIVERRERERVTPEIIKLTDELMK